MDIPPCPECGEDEHEVLRQAAEHVTVRCTGCAAVRTLTVPKVRLIAVPAIFSEGDRSWTGRPEVPQDAVVAVGMEFEHEGRRFLVTGVERQDGLAAKGAPAHALRQMAAKAFDRVIVKITLNEGDTTRSLEMERDPDDAVHVGEIVEAQGVLGLVKAMKSDQNRTIRRGFLLARSIVRVFADPAPAGAVAGSRQAAPRRGPPGPGKGTRGRPPARRGGRK